MAVKIHAHQSSTLAIQEAPKLEKKTCWQSFVSVINRIWKAICDFFCCRCCKKKNINATVTNSTTTQSTITFNTTIRKDPPSKPIGGKTLPVTPSLTLPRNPQTQPQKPITRPIVTKPTVQPQTIPGLPIESPLPTPPTATLPSHSPILPDVQLNPLPKVIETPGLSQTTPQHQQPVSIDTKKPISLPSDTVDPFSSIPDPDALPLLAPRLIELENPCKEKFLHLRINIKSGLNEVPSYYSQITKGEAHLFLNDADMEERHQPTNWGKGELAKLGECSCRTLSRTKNPQVRREFDSTVLAYAVPKILSVKRYTITNFATGNLFASFVQALQIIHALKKNQWQGKLIWNLIDTEYDSSIRSELHDVNAATEAILSFRDQIHRFLPPGIEVELNIFGSHTDYIKSTMEDGGLKYDFIQGMDLSHAYKVWNGKDLSIAARPDAYEFHLMKVAHPSIPHDQLAKGIGIAKCQLRRVDEKDSVVYEPSPNLTAGCLE